MAQPYLSQLQELLAEVNLGDTELVCKHFFSGAAAYANGKIVASLSPKGLAFKLSECRCDNVLSAGIAIPLQSFDIRSRCNLTVRKSSGFSFAVISVLFLASSPAGAGGENCYAAEAWREADALFLADPHWVGADGASSIDLGHGRTLWLFADTWVDPAGRHDRQDATFIRNSVAIQTGKNPSSSEMQCHWGSSADGAPKAFYAGDRGDLGASGTAR